MIDELIVKQQTEKLIKSVENREWGKIPESWLNEKMIDEIFKNNFSSNLIMVSNIDKLVKQQDFTSNKLGTCIIISIFNSYPNIFSNDIHLAETLIDNLDTYDEYKNVIKEINNKLLKNRHDIPGLIDIHFEQITNKCISIILNQLKLDMTTPLGYSSITGSHFVNIVGISDKFIYYFENGSDEILLLDIIESYMETLIRYRTYDQIKSYNTFNEILPDIKKYLEKSLSAKMFYTRILPKIQHLFIDLGFSSKITSINRNFLSYIFDIIVIQYKTEVLSYVNNFSKIVLPKILEDINGTFK